MTNRELPEQYLDGYAEIRAEVSATGRRLTRDEIASRRALGRAGRRGRSRATRLVSAHLTAARTAWPGTPGSADGALAARAADHRRLRRGRRTRPASRRTPGRGRPPRVHRRPPLRPQRPRPLLDTLTAYFDSGCVSAEAARRLTLSVRALAYRLDPIHKLTGADSAHRYVLPTVVNGARLVDWPAKDP